MRWSGCVRRNLTTDTFLNRTGTIVAARRRTCARDGHYSFDNSDGQFNTTVIGGDTF